MVDRADEWFVVGLADKVIDIKFGTVPAVVVHVVHGFCADGGTTIGGLVNGPGGNTRWKCRWAFIFKRKEGVWTGPAVLCEPPVDGR